MVYGTVGVQVLWQPVSGDVEGFTYYGGGTVEGTAGPILNVEGGGLVTTQFDPDWQYGTGCNGPTLDEGYSGHFGGFGASGAAFGAGGSVGYDAGFDGNPLGGANTTGIDAVTANATFGNPAPGASVNTGVTWFDSFGDWWDYFAGNGN